MQFRDKTAYVWGLSYRWDPSLSRNPVPWFPHFMPPCPSPNFLAKDLSAFAQFLSPCHQHQHQIQRQNRHQQFSHDAGRQPPPPTISLGATGLQATIPHKSLSTSKLEFGPFVNESMNIWRRKPSLILDQVEETLNWVNINKTRCQIWCTIELHRDPISKVLLEW